MVLNKLGLFLAIVAFGCIISVAKVSAEDGLLSQTVDNTPVPESILMETQTSFQGMAVTQVIREGTNYLLRVDHDDIPNDSDSFYLMYNSNWEYLGIRQATVVAPPAPAKEPDKGQNKQPEKPPANNEEDDTKPRERQRRNNPGNDKPGRNNDKPDNNHGNGNNDHNTQPEPKPTPQPEPQPIPDDMPPIPKPDETPTPVPIPEPVPTGQ